MAARYQCIRRCYHNYRRYEPGEIYVASPEEEKAGKVPRHFVMEESFSREAVAKAAAEDHRKENTKVRIKAKKAEG